MDKQQIQSIIESGVLEQYVFGTLEEKKVAEIKHLLATHPELREYVYTLEKVLFGLAQESSVAPPIYIKDAVMEVVETSKSHQMIKKSSKPWHHFLSWVLLSISIAGFAWAYRSMGIERKQRIDCQQAQQGSRPIADTYQSILNGSQKIKYLSNTNTGFEVMALLNVTNSSLTIHPQNMPSLPTGKCYQLWGDKDGKMISVAVFDPSNLKEASGPFALDQSFTSLNFTIEDLGSDGSGSDHATVANLVASVEI